MEIEVLNGQLQENEAILHLNGRYIKTITMEENISDLRAFIQTKVNLAAFGITGFKLQQSAHRTINIVPF